MNISHAFQLRGTGLEIAKMFAEEGAKVVISDMNQEKCNQACL